MDEGGGDGGKGAGGGSAGRQRGRRAAVHLVRRTRAWRHAGGLGQRRGGLGEQRSERLGLLSLLELGGVVLSGRVEHLDQPVCS